MPTSEDRPLTTGEFHRGIDGVNARLDSFQTELHDALRRLSANELQVASQSMQVRNLEREVFRGDRPPTTPAAPPGVITNVSAADGAAITRRDLYVAAAVVGVFVEALRFLPFMGGR